MGTMPEELLGQHERFNRHSAEFSDAATEQRFRQWTHLNEVRQARTALLIAIILVTLFLVSDYFLLPSRRELLFTVVIRLIIFAGGLTTVIFISRSKHSVPFDRILLTFQGLAIVLLLVVFYFLKPEIHAAIIILVTITLGMYLFIPNRFVVASSLGLFFAAGFFFLTITGKRIDELQLLQAAIIISSVNVIGATFNYRFHLLQRRTFLKLMCERDAREALQTEVARRTDLEEQLLYQAHTDELTDANNRRYFLELGHEEVSRSLRYDRPLSLLLLDLDHFKQINDTYGHDTGDEVLRRFSRLCQRTLRSPDIFGRLGGEEFAIILPEEPLENALKTAERLRGAVEQAFSDTPYHLTISIGVTDLEETDTHISDLLKRADAMMYNAKQGGRNRVISNRKVTAG